MRISRIIIFTFLNNKIKIIQISKKQKSRVLIRKDPTFLNPLFCNFEDTILVI